MEEITETKSEVKPELVKVHIVDTKGESMLVQTADFKRYHVPASVVHDGQIDKADLNKCPLYGIQWEAYLGMDTITTEALALMLRQAGIYTLADLRVKDRQLIRIGSRLVGQVVRDAAKRADKVKPPRRNNAKR